MGATPHRAWPRPAGRLAHPARGRRQRRAPAKTAGAARRRAQGPARGACRPHPRSGGPRQFGRGHHSRQRSAARSGQAQGIVAAARRLFGQHRPALARCGECRRRGGSAHRYGARAPRTHPSSRGAIGRDYRQARQPARPGRTLHPAPGQRPHPGAGAGPRRSATAARHSRQDRQADVPPGRHLDAGRAGGAGPSAAGIGDRLRLEGRKSATLSPREAGHRIGRGTHRCAAGLRPAHQRADRLVQVQHLRRAQVCAGHAGERRTPVRDRARRRGDFGARDPRADPRRKRADFGQLHRGVRQQSRHSSARGRAAGEADGDRAACRGRRPRPGFDRERQAGVLFRRGARRGLHGGDLRAVRRVRQRRRRRQRRDDLRRPVAAQCHAHVAGHHRHRPHDRNRGRQQRADLRAHPRGGAHRPHPDHRHRRRASAGRSRPSSIRTSRPSSPPRCCSSSAAGRCAASP